MDDRQKGKLDEDSIGFTGFGGGPRRNTWYTPTGRLANFFSKFFATKSQPFIVGEFEEEGRPKLPPHPLAGDTITTAEPLRPDVAGSTGGGSGARDRGLFPQPTELEIERRRRYVEFESMDDYPEIAAAFDIYADDTAQKDTQNRRWVIKTDDDLVKEEIENLFEQLKLDRYFWDIIRNVCKFGDCFTESIVNLNNPKAGIQRIKILDPNYIFRVENEYGYLTDFLQEIPRKNEWDSFGTASSELKNREFIALDRNQITHFRLRTSDKTFYPYGKSIAANARQIHRSLKLMEDAMLIYRLVRAPERRIFYIDTGNLPANKAQAHVEKTKEKFKKEKFYDTNRNQIDARYNPLAADEDYFFPMKKGSQTKVETLPGAQNLGEVDDVKYFRDKLLAILKVPKDYIVEKDKSPERKANLAQLDVKFAKVITRVQNMIELGLESIAKRHLQLKGYPSSVIRKLRIDLPSPSDMFEKRRLDLEDKKAQVVTSVMGTGLFSKRRIYKDYYGMTESEIDETIKEVEEEQEKEAEKMAEQGLGPDGQPLDPMMGGAAPGGLPEAEPSIGNKAEFSPPGGDENKPPTQESIELEILRRLRRKLLSEKRDTTVLTRRITRLQVKNQN